MSVLVAFPTSGSPEEERRHRDLLLTFLRESFPNARVDVQAEPVTVFPGVGNVQTFIATFITEFTGGAEIAGRGFTRADLLKLKDLPRRDPSILRIGLTPSDITASYYAGENEETRFKTDLQRIAARAADLSTKNLEGQVETNATVIRPTVIRTERSDVSEVFFEIRFTTRGVGNLASLTVDEVIAIQDEMARVGALGALASEPFALA